jgi:hypothetical protein
MEPNRRLRTAVRRFYFWHGSLVVFGISPFLAFRLIVGGDRVARVEGAAVGIAGSLPWMWAVFLMIRQGDEFSRRIHLIAMAAAFAGGLILLSVLHWLAAADLITTPGLPVLWVALLLIWLAAAIVAKRYFERAT